MISCYIILGRIGYLDDIIIVIFKKKNDDFVVRITRENVKGFETKKYVVSSNTHSNLVFLHKFYESNKNKKKILVVL